MTDAEIAVQLDRWLADLGGRATGLWRREENALRREALCLAADMPEEVRAGFAAATAVVPLERVELSIVRAAREGRVIVARVAELTPMVGSGYWLRALGAVRSVAVPVLEGVLSVALSAESDQVPDEQVADSVRAVARMIGRSPDRPPK